MLSKLFIHIFNKYLLGTLRQAKLRAPDASNSTVRKDVTSVLTRLTVKKGDIMKKQLEKVWKML